MRNDEDDGSLFYVVMAMMFKRAVKVVVSILRIMIVHMLR